MYVVVSPHLVELVEYSNLSFLERIEICFVNRKLKSKIVADDIHNPVFILLRHHKNIPI